jgi:phosphatidylglycerol lysyltransferase
LLFDPTSGPVNQALNILMMRATAQNRIPLVYKRTRQTALTARQVGWSVMRIAEDVIVNLRQHDLAKPARRTLRRKLRKANAAGVTITQCAPSPILELEAIDAQWQAGRGSARGRTMAGFVQITLRAKTYSSLVTLAKSSPLPAFTPTRRR